MQHGRATRALKVERTVSSSCCAFIPTVSRCICFSILAPRVWDARDDTGTRCVCHASISHHHLSRSQAPVRPLTCGAMCSSMRYQREQCDKLSRARSSTETGETSVTRNHPIRDRRSQSKLRSFTYRASISVSNIAVQGGEPR